MFQISLTAYSQSDSSELDAQITKVLSIVKQVTEEGNYSNELTQEKIEEWQKRLATVYNR